MQVIDYDDLTQALTKVFELLKGSSIHLDGKAIRSIATLGQSAKQTFTNTVRAYGDGKSIMGRPFLNGLKNNEIGTVQELIKALNLQDMVLSLDALHCQKKLYQKLKNTFKEEITIQHNSSEIACTKEVNKGMRETRVCYKTNFTDQDLRGLKRKH